MKLVVLCLLLLTACSDLTDARNYRGYALTWSCRSADACEGVELVELIDRAWIVNGHDVIDFASTRDSAFHEYAQMAPSDDLPAECSRLYGLTLLARELDPSRMCLTSRGLELELSVPDRDAATQSKWFVEGREIDEDYYP
jgi:hypothetical protein